MDLSQALEIASHTDPGMVRPHNEDSIASIPDKGLVVLADGMGGYNAGEVASGMAPPCSSERAGKCSPSAHPCGRSRRPQAAQTCWSRNRPRQRRHLPGGAKPAAICRHGHDAGGGGVLRQPVTVAHIGDSRLLPACAATSSSPVTRDHSLLQEQIDSGMLTEEQAKHSQNKNLVTRALGIDPAVEREIHDYDASRATSICCARTASTTWSRTRKSP